MADDTEAAGDITAEEFNKRLLARVNAVLAVLAVDCTAFPADYTTAIALVTVGAAMARDLEATAEDVVSQVRFAFENEFRVLTPAPLAVPDESAN